MYMPAHFEENRPEVLHRLIAEQPFGALITNGPNGLDANHVPFDAELVPEGATHSRTAKVATRRLSPRGRRNAPHAASCAPMSPARTRSGRKPPRIPTPS